MNTALEAYRFGFVEPSHVNGVDSRVSLSLHIGWTIF